jgi:hypothetical protein
LLPTSHGCCAYQEFAFCSDQRVCAQAEVAYRLTAITATVRKNTDLDFIVVHSCYIAMFLCSSNFLRNVDHFFAPGSKIAPAELITVTTST